MLVFENHPWSTLILVCTVVLKVKRSSQVDEEMKSDIWQLGGVAMHDFLRKGAELQKKVTSMRLRDEKDKTKFLQEMGK